MSVLTQRQQLFPNQSHTYKAGLGKGKALNQCCPDIFAFLPSLWVDVTLGIKFPWE